MRYLVYSFFTLLLSCNKSVVDFEDKMATHPIVEGVDHCNLISISGTFPKIINSRDISIQNDTAKMISQIFSYAQYAPILYNIGFSHNELYNHLFDYSNHRIQLSIQNGVDRFMLVAYLNNNKNVEKIVSGGDTSFFEYDAAGYLVNQRATFTNTNRFYRNGNLDSLHTFSTIAGPEDVSLKFTYYDSVEFTRNQGFFPFFGDHIQMGNFYSNIHSFGYLDIFGKGSKNLLKSIDYHYFEGTQHVDYEWKLSGNIIVLLNVKSDGNVRQLVEYYY